MSVGKKYIQFKQEIPTHVTLVSVSKTKPIALLQQAYDAGARIFGENRAQELVEKHEALPNDIKWHMIGHLQSKKVKLIAPFIDLIHSVDSIKLLETINKEAKKNNRIINCLLQFHIADEESKYGFVNDELISLFKSINELKLSHVAIIGIMGMATFTDDEKQVTQEFKNLKSIFDTIKKEHLPTIEVVSMGMSGDYKLAIKQGSTMIRVGSSIFGKR